MPLSEVQICELDERLLRISILLDQFDEIQAVIEVNSIDVESDYSVR